MRRIAAITRRRERGATLIEATVALAVFTVGLVGVLHLQMVAVRSNHMARKLALASTLAEDLVEQSALWAYDDPRLVPGETITSVAAPAVSARLGDTRGSAIPASSRPHYGDTFVSADTGKATLVAGNTNAPAALRSTTRPYEGLDTDVDRDGESDFERYWNVFALDSNSDGVAEGKLIVVVVRWFEAGLGYRRVTQFGFRSNWEVFSL